MIFSFAKTKKLGKKCINFFLIILLFLFKSHITPEY